MSGPGTITYVGRDRPEDEAVALVTAAVGDPELRHAATIDAVREEPTGDDGVLAVVVDDRLADGSVPAVCEALRERAAEVPVVAFLGADATVDVGAVYEAGADAIVRRHASDPEAGFRQLGRRLGALHPSEARATEGRWRRALDGLSSMIDGTVAVFDAEYRHVAAWGGSDGLDSGELADGAPTDVFAAEPGTYLESDYERTLSGESCRRTLPIGGRWYRVDTRPIGDGAAPTAGLVRFRDRGRCVESPAVHPDSPERLERFRDVVDEVEAIEARPEAYERVIELADRLVAFDAAAISEVEDGRFVPRAATAEALHVDRDERLGAEEGIAGRTVATGEPIFVDDLHEGPEGAIAASDEFRSVLSIPIGEDGVFQVCSTEPDAYTELDAKLVELLCRHVAHVLERASYEELLEAERDRFAALFENVPDAAVQYTVEDGQLTIDAVNAAFVRLFEFEPETVIGSTVLEELVPAEGTAAAAELHDTILDGQQIDTEVLRRTASGENPFLLRSVPVPASDGPASGYLIYTDISTMKEREQRLERKNERLDEFASIVSHDLRNPLNVARGNLDLVQSTGDLERLDEMKASLDRMERIVDELLRTAREGYDIEETVPVSLERMATESWSVIDSGAASMTIADDATVAADPQQLKLALENCFRNAIDHGPEDVAIRVGSLADGFYVADDGPGIPGDIREEVLETGFTTAEDGTGLGLGIVSRIVDGHGWRIEITEAEGGGARLEFRGVAGE